MLAVAVVGCGPSFSSLDATERQQRARIEQLDVTIRMEDARAQRARWQADFQECRARREGVMAMATITVARCEADKAEESACHAKNEGATARDGLGGCVLGIFATVVTGGGGAPLALAGCGAGLVVGGATAKDCKPATCNPDPESAMKDALAVEHVSTIPICGGVVGVTLRPARAGVEVAQVDPVGPAAMAGLRSGDKVLVVNSRPVANMTDAANVVLDMPAAGETVTLVGARGGAPFQVQLTLAPRRPGQLGL